MTNDLGKLFSKSEIISLFNNEFAGIQDKFEVVELPLVSAEQDIIVNAAKPGVYVFFKNNKVWMVGRHLLNSRKRAMEHLNVNREDYQIKNLKNDPEASLLLFNVKEHKPKEGVDLRHWVAALEIFFELRLDPLVKSARLG